MVTQAYYQVDKPTESMTETITSWFP
ncbi:uncharacterized protein METZ01_LOCUS165766 [marine metagenome]|uniref:Uncharacterized protein n=1 Tax=marine metagenome TaxID=408172 RepID=A0A382BI09_9ZZZZ